MSKMVRIISAVVLATFLLSTVVLDLAISQTFNYPNKGNNLAPSSMFDSLTGIEYQDIARIELALEGQLLDSAGKDSVIGIEKLVNGANAYRDSIFKSAFQFETPELFTNEIESLPNGCYRVMCRIYDKIHGQRTYYAVFPGMKDGDGGFPIVIYTESEWKKKNVEEFISKTKTIPRRTDNKPQDIERIDRYKKNNERAIAELIRDRMRSPDNFAEIAGRAARLGWDTEYRDRARPSHYWAEEFLTLLNNHLGEFLGIFGTSVEEALEGKNIVFIKLSPRVDYPAIIEDGREVSVRSRSSNNAVYFFLLNEDFDYLEKISVSKEFDGVLEVGAFRFLSTALAHEVGAICGLPFQVKGSRIVNDLDRAFVEYHDYITTNYGHLARRPFRPFPPREKLLDYVRGRFPKLTGLKPVDLDELTGINASGERYERDYASTGEAWPAKNFASELKVVAASREAAKVTAFLKDVAAGGLLRSGLFYDAYTYLFDFAPEEAQFIAGVIRKNPSLSGLESDPERSQSNLVRSMLENSLDFARFQHHEYRSAEETDFKDSRLTYDDIGRLKMVIFSIQQTCRQNLAVIESMEDPERLHRIYARLARIMREESRAVTPKFVVFDETKTKPRSWQGYIDAYMRAVKEQYAKVSVQLKVRGLALQCNAGDSIVIDRRVRVVVKEALRSKARLLVQAPADVELYRYEVYTDIERRMKIEASRIERRGGGNFVIDCDYDKYLALKMGDDTIFVSVTRWKVPSYSYKVKFVINAPRHIIVDREDVAEARAREAARKATEGTRPAKPGSTGMAKREPAEKKSASRESGKARKIEDAEVADNKESVVIPTSSETSFLESPEFRAVEPVPAILTPQTMAESVVDGSEVLKVMPGMSRNIAVIGQDAPHVGDKIWQRSGKYNLILPFEFFAEGDFRKHQNRYGNRFNFDRVGGITGDMGEFIKNVLAKVRPGEADRTVVVVPQARDLTPRHLDELTRAGLRYVVMKLGDINIANNAELKRDDDERLRFQEHVYDVMLLFRYLDEDTLNDSRVYGVAGAYIRSYFEFTDDQLTVEAFIEAIKKADAAQLIKGLLSYRQFRRYDAAEEHRAISAPLVFA